MYRVSLHGLEIYAYHGATEPERSVGHRFLIDVSLEVDGSADKSDKLSETVDYAKLAQLLSEKAAEAKFHTIERLGDFLCEAIFEAFSMAMEINLIVAKPLPPIPLAVESASVEITRRR
jgi:dihydroneopterin aldolase